MTVWSEIRCSGERGGVHPDHLALVVDGDGAQLAFGDLLGDLAEAPGEGHERLEAAPRLLPQRRGVDGPMHRLAAEGGEDLIGDIDGDGPLGFPRGRAEVGRRHDARVRQQRRSGRRRFHGEDIEGGASHLAFLERPQERLLVDQPPAGAVHEERARLHRGQLVSPDEGLGILRQRHVQRQDVGPAQDLLPRAQFHAEPPGPFLRHVRIVGQHPHVEGHRPPGHFAADLPEPDNAERLPGQFGAGVRLADPPARGQGGVGLRDAADQGEEHRHRVLRGRDRAALGGVEHEDPAPRGRLDVDVVHADPRAADRPEAVGPCQRRRRDPRPAADDHGVHPGQLVR